MTGANKTANQRTYIENLAVSLPFCHFAVSLINPGTQYRHAGCHCWPRRAAAYHNLHGRPDAHAVLHVAAVIQSA